MYEVVVLKNTIGIEEIGKEEGATLCDVDDYFA